ncbi:MAG: right-handed parallel beta-helix repeat-containing protein [Candidatus Thermoplasmatota archaeon]|nr:right-handed parallel beta-helix repeat-containing protein [Candidatus Thermoplasmatota archaeon]
MLVGLCVVSSAAATQISLTTDRQQEAVQRNAMKILPKSAPQLAWRFANMQIVPGSPSYFVFDVELKCDVPGTYHRDLQIYFNYNSAAFGTNIVANGKVAISDLFLMGDQPTYYYYVNGLGTDNTAIRYALITANSRETSQPGSPLYYTEVPTTWAGMVRFQLEIADSSKVAGISFASPMNAGQYYQNTSTTNAEPYAVPSLYDNDLLSYPLTDGINMYVDDGAHQTWYDATHVRTVHEAVDNVTAGATIYVFSGTYTDNVAVDKTVTITGEDKDATLISAATPTDDVFHVTADDVVINGVTISGTARPGAAILCTEVTHCYFYDSIITNNWEGIQLFYTTSSTIQDIVFSENINAINVEDGSHYNSIVNNEIIDGRNGMYFLAASYNIISGNTIENNAYDALYFEMADANVLYDNTIDSNGNYGIYFDSSSDTLIFHNNFIDNFVNAENEQWSDNDWDDGLPVGGNYWSDYTGVDGNGDGIGDTSYFIPGKTPPSEDHYPWMTPSGWL